jgi:uncharacterized protein YndB with AHSA1/START domain
MKNNLMAKITVSIQAPASKVWKALTEPKLVKQYLYGTEVSSDWKPGSPIHWTGEYNGKTYHDKGVIKKIEPEKILQHTYFSDLSGKEDKPENYATVTYTLTKNNGTTQLSLTQDNIDSEKAVESSNTNWKGVLGKLKEVVEKN